MRMNPASCVTHSACVGVKRARISYMLKVQKARHHSHRGSHTNRFNASRKVRAWRHNSPEAHLQQFTPSRNATMSYGHRSRADASNKVPIWAHQRAFLDHQHQHERALITSSASVKTRSRQTDMSYVRAACYNQPHGTRETGIGVRCVGPRELLRA